MSGTIAAIRGIKMGHGTDPAFQTGGTAMLCKGGAAPEAVRQANKATQAMAEAT